MKEYINNRISELQKEYSNKLTEIGKNSKESNSEEWVFINDKKSRIEELELILLTLNKNG